MSNPEPKDPRDYLTTIGGPPEFLAERQAVRAKHLKDIVDSREALMELPHNVGPVSNPGAVMNPSLPGVTFQSDDPDPDSPLLKPVPPPPPIQAETLGVSGSHWGGEFDKIDDRWAARTPRRWVMVKVSESTPCSWIGPKRLGMVLARGVRRYITLTNNAYVDARPATAEDFVNMDAGYRLATEEDTHRLDRQQLSLVEGVWRVATPGITCTSKTYIYRVPDLPERKLTNEDAKKHSPAMFRDEGQKLWTPAILIYVSPPGNGNDFYLGVLPDGSYSSWDEAREPTKEELAMFLAKYV